MDHRAVSLQFLRSTGLIPVKVRPGQKDPFPEWDPRRVASEDHSGTLKQLEANPEYNLGALFHGRYVDVDIDTSAPFLHGALDYFLPRTPYVWGRKSKPKSHRVFALHEDFDRAPWGPILRHIKNLKPGAIDDEGYSVEIRGGKPENGLFSVLPGSKHPSGERVEWDHEIDPTVGGAYVEAERLVKALRLAVTAAIIAPHWVEGVRNDLSLAFAGTLWRIRTSTRAAYGLEPDEEAPAGYFVLEDDDALAIFTCIMKMVDDPDPTRKANFTNTWRKLDAEAQVKVTGGKVLGELIGGETGPKVVRALYRLLSDNDAAEQIEKLAEQFVMWYGAGVLIDLHMVSAGRSIPWMTREQASNSLGGKKLIIGDKKVPLVNMLFGSTIINRVYGLTFDPSNDELVIQTGDGLQVNQWKGWALEPFPTPVSPTEIEPFLNYVYEVLANSDQAMYEWMLAWFADMFQHPSKKPGTALVLLGVQGAGKTFVGERVLGRIIGHNHYAQLNSVTKLTDKFNTVIDNKVFIQCDEATHSYQKDVASRLKSIITDERMIIEPKGVNSYSKPNHMRLLFTSNYDTEAIFIDPSPYERRFTVAKVSPHKAQDLDYWSFMHLWIEEPNTLPKIMRFLLDYKYERSLVKRPIDTAAKRDVQRVGVDPEVSWILSRMANGFPISARSHRHWFETFHTDHITEHDKKNNVLVRDQWPNRVLPAVIEDDFRHYVREHGRAVYSGSVSTNIKRVLPEGSLKPIAQTSVRYVDPKTGQATQNRIRIFSWPSQDEIMSHLRKKFGPVVEQMFQDLREFPEGDQMPDVGVHLSEEGEF